MAKGEVERICQLGNDNKASSGVEVPNILPDFIFSSFIHPSDLHLLSPYYMQNTALIVSGGKIKKAVDLLSRNRGSFIGRGGKSLGYFQAT